MSANGISTLSTKQARQVAKLGLAQTKRQGTFTRSNNGSVLLNGTQCLTVPANSAYTLGTNDHTIEFWLYQSSRNLYDIAWNYSQQSAYSTSAYYLNVGSAGVYLLLGTGTEWGVFINPPTPSLNAWHHYAIVRYGNVFTLYVDGVGYSNTYAANIPAQPGVMSMGGMPGGDSVPGYISNFRFVNGTAIYKENFTPSEATLPNVPNTKILLNTVYGSNFLVDRSSIGATVTNVGGGVSSPQYPNAVVTIDTGAPFYRIHNEYDITLLPTQYIGNTATNNLNEGGLQASRPWVTFLPSDLFASGEKGVWYDPGDITTLFQDTAGTIPVTASGQTVALMLDKSGNGINATQSDATKRPTFTIYPNSEYGYLNFDGTNDFMVTGNLTFAATSVSTITATVGVQVDTGATGSRMVIELGTDTSTSNGSFYITAPSVSSDHSFGLRGTSAITGYVANVDPSDDILTAQLNIGAATKELELIPRLNGVTKSGASITWSGAANAGTGTFGTKAMYIGARAGTSLFFKGKFYGMVVRGATSTAPQVTATEAWVTARLY